MDELIGPEDHGAPESQRASADGADAPPGAGAGENAAGVDGPALGSLVHRLADGLVTRRADDRVRCHLCPSREYSGRLPPACGSLPNLVYVQAERPGFTVERATGDRLAAIPATC
jgi:hypothetical protein